MVTGRIIVIEHLSRRHHPQKSGPSQAKKRRKFLLMRDCCRSQREYLLSGIGRAAATNAPYMQYLRAAMLELAFHKALCANADRATSARSTGS